MRHLRNIGLSIFYLLVTLVIVSSVYQYFPHSKPEEKVGALGVCLAIGTLLTVLIQIYQGTVQIELIQRQSKILENQETLLNQRAKLYAYCAHPEQLAQYLGANMYQLVPFQLIIFNNGTKIATTYRLRIHTDNLLFDALVGAKSIQAKAMVVVASKQKGNTYDFDFEHRVYPGEKADGPMLQFKPTAPGTHSLQWQLTFDDGMTPGDDKLTQLSTVEGVLKTINAR